MLRYFESREEVLLELLDAEQQDWLAYLDRTLESGGGTPRERGDRLAVVLAESLAQRPVLCDLTSAHASVLDHNVSAEVALRHKRATRHVIETQAGLILRCLPELGAQDAARLVAMTTLFTAGAWPYSRPPEALRAAYAADPALAAMQVDITDLLRQSLAVTISGLLARGEDLPVGPTVCWQETLGL